MAAAPPILYHEHWGRSCSYFPLHHGHVVPTHDHENIYERYMQNSSTAYAPTWYHRLMNGANTHYASAEEVRRAALECAHHLEAEERQCNLDQRMNNRWAQGVEVIRNEVKERILLAEYKCANIRKEVERASKQVEFTETLNAYYPEELGDEKEHMSTHAKHVLRKSEYEEQELNLERRHVTESLRLLEEGALELRTDAEKMDVAKKARRWEKEINREKYFHNVFRYDWKP
mmetsp:Transcript_8709/g.14987  ORF Transcript_8709/g.14987 Transcript_8709/m.14987 type:complete len:231 (-) Transcript_8709:69-761(-)|eukprot:CAMPEP_0198231194 /NCGR_PEP_ID=MMETSP1445-20131203/115072_1 /TAXON_ID=36898 /ORGANISM="Pyramimonas sp., Strain CCMP2087" /LENGTH=230 /DNA_ID=CAMNT_0043911793 /DNA_START=137 /DNA_END=829 /DNA_ORIENTATION=-